MKYCFELQEACFGEDDELNEKELENLVKEILLGGFYATDHEECDKDEIRICLSHLEGFDDEDLGYYWLKFKVKGVKDYEK